MDDDLHELSRTVILGFGEATDHLGQITFQTSNEGSMFTGTLMKIWQHGLSALKLCEEPIADEYPDFRDYASIPVIARATLESAGVFKYIFYNGLGEDEKRFLLDYMEMRGLMVQTGFQPTGVEERAKQAKSQARIDQLKIELQNYDFYKQLNSKARGNVLRGYWEPFTKSSLSGVLGFGPKAQATYYRFLSDYTHNGYLATLQVSQPTESQSMARTSLMPIALTQSSILKTLSEHIPETQAFLKGNAKLDRATDLYIRFGAL